MFIKLKHKFKLKIKKRNNLFFSFIFFLVFLFISCSSVYAVTPDEISGLKLWLDASYGVTTDGSTPATDGDTVQQWDDRSSGGYDAAQLTVEKQPTYKTSIINGNPVLRFNGAHNIVTSSFLDSSFNTNFTFFIVETKVGTSLEVTTSNQNNRWYTGSTSNIYTNTNNLSPQSITAYRINGLSVADPKVETYVYNGTEATLRFTGIPRSVETTGNLGLSGSLTIGSLSTNSFYYHGDIAEIIIYNSALNSTQIDQIETYLMTKYGITSAMPSVEIPLFVFDGDSMTYGTGASEGYDYPNQVENLLGLTATYQNLGVSGQTVADMSSDASSQIDPEYQASRETNIVVLFGGTNDLGLGADATTTYNRIVSYSQDRRTTGFKVIVNTILPKSDDPLPFNTDRQTVNSLIRSNWSTFADGISDIASDSNIGTYSGEYYSDTIHLNDDGYGVVSEYVTAAIKQIMEPISVSTVSVTPLSTAATVTWSTNQTGSTKVNYGLTSSYGSSTTESDTSTRVLSHSTELTNLVSCTTYHYQAVSNDLNSNNVTSEDNTFTTTGCTASSSVDTTATSAITAASGGTLSLLDGSSQGVSLTVPASFAGSDANFQAHKLDKTTVLASTSTPSGYTAAGDYVYELSALTDVSTKLTSFDQAITVTMAYGTSDISGIDESSLKIYRWDGSSWNQLSGCSVDTSAKTVSCTTTAFSTFVLFGQANSGSTSSSSTEASAQPTPQGCEDLAPGEKTPWLYAATTQDGTSIMLYFAQAADPVSYYALEFGTESGNYQFSATNIGGSDARTYLVESLQPNTTYYFRVRAGNGCATGEWGNEISATTKSSLGYRQLETTNLSLEPVAKEEAQENDVKSTTESEQVGGYKLNITVKDDSDQPVAGAKVMIHSKVQETTTDENGMARFENVEPGDHKVLVTYDGYEGEQSINLSGEVKEFNLNIQVTQTNAFFNPLVMLVMGIFTFIVLSLVFLLVKQNLKK